MSDTTQERGASPVVTARQPWFTRVQKVTFVLFGLGALLAFVFWRSSHPPPPPASPEKLLDKIADIVQYEPPPAPKPEPKPAALPASPSPPLARPLPAAPISPLLPPAPPVHIAPPKPPEPHMIAFDAPAGQQQAKAAMATGGAADGEAGGLGTQVAWKSATVPGGKAGTIGDQSLILMPGLIPCVLDTAIDSTLPGPISCHVTQDMLSPAGVTLLDRGTKIVGEYKNNIAQGQNRLFTMAATAYTPSGCVVPLDSPMADGLGRAGLDGNVDNHTWERFGGAVLLSLIDSSLGVLQSALSSGNNTYLTFQSGGISSLADQILRATINIPPTITKYQGERVTIFLRYPINFSGCYRLRARR
jgi:type IV secretion system protein VirB10